MYPTTSVSQLTKSAPDTLGLTPPPMVAVTAPTICARRRLCGRNSSNTNATLPPPTGRTPLWPPRLNPFLGMASSNYGRCSTRAPVPSRRCPSSPANESIHAAAVSTATSIPNKIVPMLDIIKTVEMLLTEGSSSCLLVGCVRTHM
jgi:hypothetical protein